MTFTSVIAIFAVGGEQMNIHGASGAVPRDDLDRMDAHAVRYYEYNYKRFTTALDREAGIR